MITRQIKLKFVNGYTYRRFHDQYWEDLEPWLMSIFAPAETEFAHADLVHAEVANDVEPEDEANSSKGTLSAVIEVPFVYTDNQTPTDEASYLQ